MAAAVGAFFAQSSSAEDVIGVMPQPSLMILPVVADSVAVETLAGMDALSAERAMIFPMQLRLYDGELVTAIPVPQSRPDYRPEPTQPRNAAHVAKPFRKPQATAQASVQQRRHSPVVRVAASARFTGPMLIIGAFR